MKENVQERIDLELLRKDKRLKEKLNAERAKIDEENQEKL